MPRHRGSAAAQQQAIDLPGKKVVRNALTNSGQKRRGELKTVGPQSKKMKNGRKSRLAWKGMGTVTPEDSSQTGESDESGHDDDSDDHDNESDEPNEFAPSGTDRRKRGHRTGLSISFCRTNIEDEPMVKKRTWSNRVSEEDEISRLAKSSKLGLEEDALTSDDNAIYDAVNLISESEDEIALERDEEQLIVQSEEAKELLELLEPNKDRPSDIFESSSTCGAPGPSVPEDSFFSEQFARSDRHALHTQEIEGHVVSPVSPSPPLAPAPTPVPTRRVRFADDVGGELHEKSSVKRRSVFDQYADHGENDSLFGLPLLPDTDSDNGDSWLMKRPSMFDMDSDELDDLSGYETDEGETTDEECMPPTTIRHPESLLRLDSTPRPKSTPATPTSRLRAMASKIKGRNGPVLGSWITDPTKPIAILDSTGKNLIFYPAKYPQKTSRPGSSMGGCVSPIRPSTRAGPLSYESENDRSDASNQGMMVESPANLMMSGLNGRKVNATASPSHSIMGPPEAFYPFRSVDQNGNVIDDDEDYGAYIDDDEDDDLEANLNIHDFIDFGEDSETETEADGADSSLDHSPTINAGSSAFRRMHERSQRHDRQSVPAYRNPFARSNSTFRPREPLSPSRLKEIKRQALTTQIRRIQRRQEKSVAPG